MTENGSNIRIWGIFRLYHPNFSGAAFQGHQCLSRLARKGFSVTILTAGERVASHLKGTEVQRDGLKIRYMATLPPTDWHAVIRFSTLRKALRFLNSLARKLFWSIQCAWLLWREGKRGDIVHFYSHNEFSFIPILVVRACSMHSVLRITLLGADDPSSFNGSWTKNILGRLHLQAYRKVESVVSLASALTQSCRVVGIDMSKVIQIPNGVDMDVFYPIDEEKQKTLKKSLGLSMERYYIAFVGAAINRKGIDVLIRAFVRVAHKIDNVDILVIGPYQFNDLTRYDSKRKELVSVLRDELHCAGYASRVHWIGETENVPEYLRAANIFCLPTRREGLPNSVLEAMATGLPIVTSNLEGITTDLISDKVEGRLIVGYNPEDYAEVLNQLLLTLPDAVLMGTRARLRVENEFSIELVVNQYEQFYQRLVDENK